MGISFDNNYGITKQEWRTFKKELKAADKANDSFKLSKKDYKEIRSHIESGDLGAYMDRLGNEMKTAIGLSLSGKVDDLTEAQKIAKGTDLNGADVDKVLSYIRTSVNTPKNNDVAIRTMSADLGGSNPVTGNEKVDFYSQTKPFIDDSFMDILA